MLDISKDLEKATAVLKKGGVILYPTDTIWGLGCDATNAAAVARLFEIKHRPGAKAMISLVPSLDALEYWVGKVPEVALNEMNAATRPLTVIYPNPRGIADALVADDSSAAFRIPSLEFTRNLCRLLGKPLVSTSPNISGKEAPGSFKGIDDEIKSRVDYICDFGRDLPPSEPSRIIKVSRDNEISVIRM